MIQDLARRQFRLCYWILTSTSISHRHFRKHHDASLINPFIASYLHSTVEAICLASQSRAIVSYSENLKLLKKKFWKILKDFCEKKTIGRLESFSTGINMTFLVRVSVISFATEAGVILAEGVNTAGLRRLNNNFWRSAGCWIDGDWQTRLLCCIVVNRHVKNVCRHAGLDNYVEVDIIF